MSYWVACIGVWHPKFLGACACQLAGEEDVRWLGCRENGVGGPDVGLGRVVLRA